MADTTAVPRRAGARQHIAGRTPAVPGPPREALRARLRALADSDPLTAPHPLRTDALIAALCAALGVLLALVVGEGHRPGPLGWALLSASAVPLVWRRRHPLLVLVLVVALVLPYHLGDNAHLGPTLQSYLAIHTVAATGRPARTLVAGIGVLTVLFVAMRLLDTVHTAKLLQIGGWILAMLFAGVSVRNHRERVGAVVERAERAERTREEEAARRVAEERLRIARDLHDLLAHSITLIGVQTSVAAHLLTVAPESLDRAALIRALDGIADTCRDARGELRSTLEVLRARAHEPLEPAPGRAPLPGLDGLPDLAAAARTAGAQVELRSEVPAQRQLPPAVGAAAYRIVQEALTNAVRHGGEGVRITAEIRLTENGLPDDGLTENDLPDDDLPENGLTQADASPPAVDLEPAATASGTTSATASATAFGTALRVIVLSAPPPHQPAPPPPQGPPGFGLVGMGERARSVGGTLSAGPRPDGRPGFAVRAVLPLTGAQVLARPPRAPHEAYTPAAPGTRSTGTSTGTGTGTRSTQTSTGTGTRSAV